MIKTFKSAETQKLWENGKSLKFPKDIQQRALRKLFMLDSAQALVDMQMPPSNHLEKLLGTRKDQYSIRINQRWRLCFQWENGDAFDVEIVDYH